MEPVNHEELHFSQEKTLVNPNRAGSVAAYQVNDLQIAIDSLTVTQKETFEVRISGDVKNDINEPSVTAILTEVTVDIISSKVDVVQKSNEKCAVTGTGVTDDKSTKSYMLKVEQKKNGEFFIIGMCARTGTWKLDVSLADKPIKGSPLMINVDKEPLIETININKMVTDVSVTNEGFLLIAYLSREILKYNSLTKNRSLISCTQNVNFHRMRKRESDTNIVFSDTANKCIVVCEPDGHIIKTIGKGVMIYPSGFDVKESKNEVYVADFAKDCIFNFRLDNGCLVRKIGSNGSEEGHFKGPKDVTLTDKGKILVADTWNHRIQMFDADGLFNQVLIKPGQEQLQ